MPQGNSFVSKEEKRPDFEERKKDIQQFSNVKQVKRKKESPMWTWIRDMFFSGRSMKDILKDVAENQIVPQMKDNFRNSLVSMIDLGMYKEHKGSGSTPSGSFITNYVNFSKSPQPSNKALEENKKRESDTISSGYETPAFKFRKDAEDFIASMRVYIQKYHTMSVQDLAWMQNKTVDYVWDKYGWEEDEILAIKEPTHINNPDTPWAVSLPKAHVLE